MDDINFFPDIKFTEDGTRVGFSEPEKKAPFGYSGNLAEINSKANIPFRFWNTSLSDFQTKYTDEIREFSVASDNDKVFILFGGTGVGKTTLMIGAMHERAVNGLNCGIYLSARIIPAVIRSSKNFNAAESEADFYKRITTVPFLCLDEVGTSDDVALEADFLRIVIALRYDNCLRMMISTNMSWESFRNFVSKENPKDPILDRLKAISIRRGLSGDSYRSEK